MRKEVLLGVLCEQTLRPLRLNLLCLSERLRKQMRLPTQYDAARELEKYLGDPLDPSNPFSYKRAVELDEREEYPEEACALLNRWGFHEYYVPVRYGGRLRSYEELCALVRVVARRDMTVGVTHLITHVASSIVWVVGTEPQKQRLAEIIKDQQQVGIGYHEKEHGNDLLACEMKATKNSSGFLLSGQKWVIGNPRRASTLVIYARTEAEGGPRGFSTFLVEKKRLPESSYSYLPKFRTHGVRGHEMSGICFDRCPLPSDALLGAPGSGLEVVLKSSQIARATVNATCLGAVDTALRTTLRFALARRLYGDVVFAIPHAQRLLVDAFLDLMICDCVAIAAARLLHEATAQMSVGSAVAKYFVPTTSEQVIRNLAIVLGARSYLREGHDWGIFEKIVRDCAITGLVHFSSTINLSHLAAQLRQLTEYRAKTRLHNSSESSSRLESVYALEKPLSPFEPENLELFNRGRDDALNGVEIALSRLHALKTNSGVAADVLENLISLACELIKEIEAHDQSLIGCAKKDGRSFDKSPEIFEFAKKHCILHAAAACLQMWLRNREALGEFFARGEWLVLCLERLMANFHPSRRSRASVYAATVAGELVLRYQENKLFSIIPLQLVGEVP